MKLKKVKSNIQLIKTLSQEQLRDIQKAHQRRVHGCEITQEQWITHQMQSRNVQKGSPHEIFKPKSTEYIRKVCRIATTPILVV